ncbi:MAG: hypothetical protein NTW19_06845, partial [Planctomycetota bacterium]|nr:hypothetical protein [Planctomycetota bacterium]
PWRAGHLVRPRPGAPVHRPRQASGGKPATLATRDDFDACYESQHDYLARLDLLTSEEAALIAARGGHVLAGSTTIPYDYWTEGVVDLDAVPLRGLEARELAEIAEVQAVAGIVTTSQRLNNCS